MINMPLAPGGVRFQVYDETAQDAAQKDHTAAATKPKLRGKQQPQMGLAPAKTSGQSDGRGDILAVKEKRQPLGVRASSKVQDLPLPRATSHQTNRQPLSSIGISSTNLHAVDVKPAKPPAFSVFCDDDDETIRHPPEFFQVESAKSIDASIDAVSKHFPPRANRDGGKDLRAAAADLPEPIRDRSFSEPLTLGSSPLLDSSFNTRQQLARGGVPPASFYGRARVAVSDAPPMFANDKENQENKVPAKPTPLPDSLLALPEKPKREPLGTLAVAPETLWKDSGSEQSSADDDVDDAFADDFDAASGDSDDSVFAPPASDSVTSCYETAPSSAGLYQPAQEFLDNKEFHGDLVYCCPIYVNDIYNYLRERERICRPKPTYMNHQKDLAVQMRAVLIDWMVEVTVEFKLSQETLYLAVNYVDRFLSLMTVARTKLQLLGTAALFVASKFEEIYPPETHQFVYITDDSYTLEQVLKMERLILSTLKFDVSAPTANCFLGLFLKVNGAPRQTNFLAQFLLDLALIDYDFLRWLPSVLAASATCLANLTTNHIPWSEEIEVISGYTVPAFHACMTQMLHAFQHVKESPQAALREKYSEPQLFQVSTLTPPEKLPPATSSDTP